MPPVILVGLGLLGAAALGRLLVHESRRVNATLHPRNAPGERAGLQRLERDPDTGVYRPK